MSATVDSAGTAATPLELAPGVSRVGGIVEVDGRISWFAPEARGFAPVNEYLLVAGDQGLLIDTGVAVHEQTVISGVRAALPLTASLGLLLTRIPEYDSFGNAAALARACPVTRIYAHFPSEEWLHYQPEHDRPGATPDLLWPPDRKIEFLTPLPGDVLELGPDRSIELIGAPVRILATYWVYDRASKTLFSSDMFSHVLMRSADEPLVVEEDDDSTTLDDVLTHLRGKFEWLTLANTAPLRTELARIFNAYEIETIAPGIGKILRGRAVVSRHYDLVDRALAEIGVGDGA